MTPEYHKTPTAWIPVARNIDKFACLDREDNILCSHHRSIRGMLNCRKGKFAGALLKDGKLVRITCENLTASNGERACLPFPTRAEDYEAVMKCDRRKEAA